MVFLNQRHLASAIGLLLVIVLFLLDRLPVRRPAVEEGPAVAEVTDPAITDPAIADAEPADPRGRRPARPRRTSLPRPANPARVIRDTLRDPALPGFVLCGALAGMLPLWNGSIYVAAVALLGLWFVLFPNRPQMIVLAAAAAALSIPQLLWVRPGTMAGEQTYPAFFWGYVIDDPTVANVASYLAFVFGPKLLLAAVALAAASWRQWRVFIAFSGLVALAFMMQLSVEVLANHKFINAWLIVANVFAAQGLIRLWRARPTAVRVPARIAAVALAAIIVVGGVIDLIPVKNQSMLEFGMDGDPLYEWVRTETAPKFRVPHRHLRRQPDPPGRARDLLRLAVLRLVCGLRRAAPRDVVSRRPGRAKPSPCRRAAARAGDRLRGDRRRPAPARRSRRSSTRRCSSSTSSGATATTGRTRTSPIYRVPSRPRSDRRASGRAGREHVRGQRNGRARQPAGPAADWRSRAAARYWSPTPATTGCSASHRTAT